MLLTLLQFFATKFLFLALHLESGCFPRPLTAREEAAAFRALHAGDAAAREKLIRHNLRLVAHIVKKYYAQHCLFIRPCLVRTEKHMLSVGLCLSAGLPAGFLVFLGLIGALGGINDCLIQFQLLPCGAVQPLDFFDPIVGVGSCDTLAQLFPAFFGFGVMHHHFNGELFRMAHSPPVTSLSPHSYGSRVVRYSLRLPVRTFNARLTSNAISMRSISVLVPVWGLPCGAERFLRSERLPGRPHTGSSVWIRPPVWYFCGSFAYSFSLIYKNAVRVPPERRLEKVLYGLS